MVTLSQFIAEIKSELPTYADDIDEISVKLNVIDSLKKFGNNICEINECIIDVDNSRAVLPEDFKNLKVALNLTPYKYHCKKNNNITESYIYKQRVENGLYFDDITQAYLKDECKEPKLITESIIINNEPTKWYYKYQHLSLVKGINKDYLASDCLNLHPSIRGEYKNQISITKNSLNTNFREGKLYLQYNSLPTDEDGEIVIPEFTTGDLYMYIKTVVKVAIAEFLIVNNLNPIGIVQLYPNWAQSLPSLKRAAQVETKFAGAGNWQKNLKVQNNKIFNSYNTL